MLINNENYHNATVNKNQLERDKVYSTVMLYDNNAVITYGIFCVYKSQGYFVDLALHKITDLDSIHISQVFTEVSYDLNVNTLNE